MAVAPPDLLTVDEAAKLLKQSRPTIYRKLRAHELRGVRVGANPRRPLRIPASELLRYLESNGLEGRTPNE
jgi:excisionase family DNA binding protein